MRHGRDLQCNEAAVGPSRPRYRRFGHGWRLWALRTVAFTVAPLLVLGIGEGAMWLLDVGTPTRFLIKNGKHYVPNPWFQWQFSPLPSHLPAVSATPTTKPAKTYRIVVVGESAAYGTPIPAFSFGRMLKVMLEHRHRAFRFDVINAAVPGLNSHALLQVVKDTTVLEPDVYLIYMGNNEVTGCYGVGTTDGRSYSKRWIIRCAIAARSLRIGQMLLHLIPARGWSMRAEEIRGTEDRMALALSHPVARDDPRLSTARDHLRANLEDMFAAARSGGARVVVSTVASNLRDWAPFASQHRADLTAAERDHFHGLYEAGIAAEDQQRWTEAIDKFRQAAAVDGQYADVNYRLGRCLLAAGAPEEAGRHLRLAMSLDTLRIRTDSDLNHVIRGAAIANGDRGVRLVDCESIFAEHAHVAGIPGSELFFDHVHMTFDGNYLLASACLDDVEASLGLCASTLVAAPDKALIVQKLALTPWDTSEIAKAIDMFKRYYTRSRSGPGGNSSRSLSPMEVAATKRMYQEAIAGDPGDVVFREHYARFLQAQAAWSESEKHLRLLTHLVPQWWEWQIQMAQAHVQQGRMEEAVQAYRRALRLNPHHERAWMALAAILDGLNHHDQAIRCLRKAIALNPRMPVPYVSLGNVYMETQSYERAHEVYMEATRLAPQSPEIIGRLAWFYAVVPRRELRNGSVAVELAERACGMTDYSDLDLLTVLVEAYVEAGQTENAMNTGHRVSMLAQESGRTDVLARLEHADVSVKASNVSR